MQQRAQEQRIAHSANHYNKLRQKLPTGPVQRERARNTEINIDGIWRRWIRFCEHLDEDPLVLITTGSAQDFMTFFKWILDNYRGVKKQSALHEYFRVFKMLFDRHNKQWMPYETVLSINSYLGLLYKRYGLDRSIPMKAVMSVDDLVLVLHHHWVRDDSLFDDERQRVQLAFLLLLAAYTGQRPCSILETTRKRGPLPAIESGDDCLKDMSEEDQSEDDNKAFAEIDKDIDDNTAEASRTTDLPRGILYSHVRIRVLPGRFARQRNPLVMEVTIVHTKGEERNPQPKTFLFYENMNLLLCPIAHMLALALHDDAFEASSLSQVKQIFNVNVPSQKKSVTLWWKDEKENIPVLRQAAPTNAGRRTSAKLPLTSAASSRALSRLGMKVGLEHRLQHYSVRRGTGNAVDGVASVHELSQVMGHRNARTFEFYRNQRVKCDVQAAFLGQPSETTLMKALGQMSLTVNPDAPTELTLEQKKTLMDNPTISKLRRKRDEIKMAAEAVSGEQQSDLWKKKCLAETNLQAAKVRLRANALQRAREQFFRNADTHDIDTQFGATAENTEHHAPLPALKYQTKERARMVRLLAQPEEGLSDERRLTRRIDFVRSMMELCDRKEARCRPTDPIAPKYEEEPPSPSIPKRIDRRQCLFCLCDKRKSYERRERKYARPAKMMDHVEKDHLKGLDTRTAIACPHPLCRSDGVVLQGIALAAKTDYGLALRKEHHQRPYKWAQEIAVTDEDLASQETLRVSVF
ncbi:MAG: hypothetical protein M1828_007228 [Chrysothrix sp. TS-e1954]|nr:MAG: hypothetical protein M1828_007228 [Chrysothrix sp. TS-e1954]